MYVNISCSSLISLFKLTAWCLRWLCTSRMWGQLKLVKQVALWLSDHKPTTVLAQGMSRWTLVSNHFPNLWEYKIDQESGFVTLWSQMSPWCQTYFHLQAINLHRLVQIWGFLSLQNLLNHCFPRWVLKVRLQLLVSPSRMHPNLEESVFLLCIWICIFVTLPGFTISFTFLAGVCPGSNSWRHDPCVWTCALAGGRWIYRGYTFVFYFFRFEVFQRPISLIDLSQKNTSI